jgi:hypothetical protein
MIMIVRRVDDDDDDLGVVPDGGRVSVPMQFMDDVQHAIALGASVHDAPAILPATSLATASPTDDDARQRVEAARDDYVRKLSDAWQAPASISTEDSSQPPPNVEDARERADGAYASYVAWLRDAWRSR